VFLKHLYLIGRATIRLFKSIRNIGGRKPIDGKSEGGIKVHLMLNAYEQLSILLMQLATTTHFYLN
jgi:hypothetical protein